MVNTAPYVTKKPRVNLANFFSIKKVLDEELIEFICVNGYRELHLFTDIRNVIIILSIICGCLAQFYFKFPENYWGIFGCIVGYAFFTVLAHGVEWLGMNGNTHIIILDGSLKQKANVSQLHATYSIGIRSELKPYSYEWNLIFTSRTSPKHKYSTVVDIRQMFDVNGEFVKRSFDKKLSAEFVELLKAFNRKSD